MLFMNRLKKNLDWPIAFDDSIGHYFLIQKAAKETCMKLNPVKQTTGRPLFYAIVIACMLSTPLAIAGDVPSFSIGAFGGFATSAAGEAVEDYQDTEWEAGSAFGGSIMYRRANGLMFELLFEQFEMGLEELGVEYGTLKATPILLMVGY